MDPAQSTMPLNCEPSNSIGSIRTDTVEASAVSTLSVALAVIILGTALIDPSRLRLLFIPGTFLLGAYGLGLFLEQTTKLWTDDLPTNRPVLILTARLSVGMSLIGLSATILGLIGLYHLTGLLIILGLIWSLLKNLRPLPPLRLFRPTYTSFSGGLAMGLVWCLTWLWATIPPTFYDELAYHLPIAQYALQTGSLPSLPWSFFTYMPHLSDLFLGWGLALAGGIGARAMHFAFWIAVWIAGWAIIESLTIHERRPWIGYVIAGTFASSSTFLFLGALPFAETSLTFAVLASTALLALPAATPWLLIGLLWGFAMSVKLSGLSWVVAGAAAALILKWPVRLVIKAGLVSLALALPWWGRAWWLTGNPLYPMGYRWLGGRYWNDASQARLQGDLPSLPEPSNILSLLHLPFDMITAPERFGSASDCGPLAVMAVCLILSLPLWAVLMRVDHNTRLQCFAAGLFTLIATASWIMTSTTTRFLAPAFMFGLSVLAALLIKAPKAILALFLTVLTVLGGWGASRFISTHTQVFSSEQVALGQEAGEKYAARTLDYYEAAMFVQNHLPPDAKLLLIGESRPFYFDRPVLAPYPTHEHPLAQWLVESSAPEQLRDRIHSEGFTHVILNTREFKRLHDKYQMLAFNGPDASLYDQRLKQLPRTMTTRFAQHNVYVFEIPSTP